MQIRIFLAEILTANFHFKLRGVLSPVLDSVCLFAACVDSAFQRNTVFPRLEAPAQIVAPRGKEGKALLES